MPKNTSSILLEAERKARIDAESARNKLYRLQYVTSALAQALTPKEIAEIVVTLGATTLSASAGSVWLFDKEKKLRNVAYTGYKKEAMEGIEEVRQQDSTPTLDSIRKKKPIILRSLDDRKQLYPHTAKIFGISQKEGFIAIPLLVGESALGAINFAFDTYKDFSPDELEFIYTLTGQCSQALDRARLYQEEKEYRQEIEKSAERLKILQEFTQELSSSLTIQEMEKIVIKKAMRILHISGGSLCLLSEDGKTLQIKEMQGYAENVIEKWREYPVKRSIPSGDAVLSKKAIFIGNRIENRRKYPKIAHQTISEAFAALPLISMSKVLGVLNFSFPTEKNYSPEEKEFMMTLADNCAQALDRAFSYQKAEEYAKEIEKRESRFKSLIENSTDAIILIDKNFRILYRSQSSERITGEAPHKRIGKPVLDVIHTQDKEKVKKWLSEIMESPQGKPISLRFRRKNKEKTLWIEATGANFLNDPLLQAIVANYRDVTDKVEFEDALRKSKEELEIILQNVMDAVVVMDSKGKVVYANPAAFTLQQFSSVDEVKHLSYFKAISEFKGFYDDYGNSISMHQMPVQRVLRGEKNVNQVLRMEFRDGREDTWRLVKTNPIYDESGKITYVVSIYSDITEEKQKEKLKDEFISTASHELKTPITSAKLYAGLLQSRLQEIRDEKAFGILTKVDVQLDRLTRLINDLLDVSKMSAGKIQLNLKEISFDQLVKEVVEEMQYTTMSHQIILTGSTNASVFADKERLSQVLMNLISNAIKYSPKSHRVDVMLSQDKTCLKVCVKDYGIGIRQESLNKIFEAFYRESHDKGARYPGLGLGLHISSEIIKRHNGTISVESTYGKGSTFCVTIPKVNEKNTHH